MQSFLLFQMLRQQKDACKAIVLDKNKLIKDFQEVEIALYYDSVLKISFRFKGHNDPLGLEGQSQF